MPTTNYFISMDIQIYLKVSRNMFDIHAIIDAALFAAVTNHFISVAGNTPDQPWVQWVEENQPTFEHRN